MADVTLRGQRPSTGRLVLPGLGALFMLALSLASVVNVTGDGSTVAIVLMIAILGTTAWLCWDLLKALGVVPLARVSVSPDAIVVHAPGLGWWGRRRAMTPGTPLQVDVLRQSAFLGTTYMYRFSQEDTKTSIVGPAEVREADLDALSDALAELDTVVTVGVMDLGRGRGRR
ncbi:hypothetical protein [Demequina sp. NBRC 110054]|uniref:hypothetical protein n=1 Tax=Demequina sp. NBRC 110054 TaxID=1570343 RepID=UPI000A053463|nr:hypothetical protein [Demequina sp. NBRC 110054]